MSETKSDTVSPKKSTKPVNAIIMLKKQKREETHKWIKLCESEYRLGESHGNLETLKTVGLYQIFLFILLIMMLVLAYFKIEIPLLPVWVFISSFLVGEATFKWRDYRLRRRYEEHKERLKLLEDSILESYKEEE